MYYKKAVEVGLESLSFSWWFGGVLTCLKRGGCSKTSQQGVQQKNKLLMPERHRTWLRSFLRQGAEPSEAAKRGSTFLGLDGGCGGRELRPLRPRLSSVKRPLRRTRRRRISLHSPNIHRFSPLVCTGWIAHWGKNKLFIRKFSWISYLKNVTFVEKGVPKMWIFE